MVLLGQKNVFKRAMKGLDPCLNGVRLNSDSLALSAVCFGAPPDTKVARYMKSQNYLPPHAQYSCANPCCPGITAEKGVSDS